MKIALVSPFDATIPGGVTEHLRGLGGALQQQGHDVFAITTGSSAGDEASRRPYHVGRPITIPINGSQASVTLDVRCFGEVTRLLRKERVDVVHVHQPFAPVLSHAALLGSRAVNVGTFHALHPRNMWYLLAKPYLLFLLDRLDARIAVSAPVCAELQRHFGGKYEVIPNGVDLDRFGPHVEPFDWARDGVPRVLFVGRFTERRKGFADLLQAMALVRRQLPKARLVVVGPGDPAKLAAEGDTDCVDFAGSVSSDMPPRYYASCEVCCAPSTGRESFGLVLLEAMASGVPVVATAIPGYASLISDGQNGLLVPPRRSDALAAALLTVLTDHQLSASLCDTARGVAEQYAWPRIASRVLIVYEEALRSRSQVAHSSP